jgi:rhomboid protease GluP
MANAWEFQCGLSDADLVDVAVGVSMHAGTKTHQHPDIAWVTSFLFFGAIAIFAAVAVATDGGASDAAQGWAYRSAFEIWGGSYWALLTSSFVHVELWHLVANLYWLWTLGRCLELVLGPIRFLLLVLASSFVSSAFQLAISDDTGIGASGVVYALFGFMWICRSRIPEVCAVLDARTITLFVGWQLFCFALSFKGVPIGNAAHVSGFVLGTLLGGLRVGWRPRLLLAASATVVAAALLVVVWAPWSPTWTGRRAYEAHFAERYEEALDLYDRVVQLDPESTWAYRNRSMVRAALGDAEGARADLDRAEEIEPQGEGTD